MANKILFKARSSSRRVKTKRPAAKTFGNKTTYSLNRNNNYNITRSNPLKKQQRWQ